MNLATLKLVNSYFWKTYYGPIFAILFPILMLIILGNILKIEYVYPGIIALSTMFIGILSMPILLSELKQSSLFKYIGTTTMTPLKLILTIVIYFFFVAIVSTTLILLVTLGAFYKKVFPHSNYDEGILSGLGTTSGGLSFVFSWLLHFIFSIGIGVLMFSIMKRGQTVAIVAFAIAIPSMFLSGMILSVDIISQSTIMQWISRFDPFRYTTGNLIVSATPKAQLGDLFQVLSPTDKALIFKSGANFTINNDPRLYFFNIDKASGNINVQYYEASQQQNYLTIDNADVLTKFINSLPKQSRDLVIFEPTLYRLLFETKAPIVASSNNIFNFKSWGVRRLPDIHIIKDFVTQYFKGETGKGDDMKRFDGIWASIKKEDYTWLDIFFKQNTTLYYVGDKIANLLVPTALSIGLFAISKKEFNWK